MNPRFYFATSQVGAEKAVKTEVLNQFPHLRFAFTRPGFVTFKEEDDSKPLIEDTGSVFARVWGTSIGQAKDEATLLPLVEMIPEKSIVHLYERDISVPGDERDDFVANARIGEVAKSLFEKSPKLKNLRWNDIPQQDEIVFDLIWIDDYHVFLGQHIHQAYMDPAPGNQPAIELPKTSPSRAYLKIAEAIHRFEPEINPGEQVLEIGCSPGGASMCMLGHGLRVVGVDPKKMDASLYDQPMFSHIQKMAKDITASDLRSVNPEWIVMDMNIAPLEAIDELGHVISLLDQNFGSSLKLNRGFLTIKLNDWKFADSIPLYMKRLSELGFHNAVATQLCSNRQEFFVSADFAIED